LVGHCDSDVGEGAANLVLDHRGEFAADSFSSIGRLERDLHPRLDQGIVVVLIVLAGLGYTVRGEHSLGIASHCQCDVSKSGNAAVPSNSHHVRVDQEGKIGADHQKVRVIRSRHDVALHQCGPLCSKPSEVQVLISATGEGGVGPTSEIFAWLVTEKCIDVILVAARCVHRQGAEFSADLELAVVFESFEIHGHLLSHLMVWAARH